MGSSMTSPDDFKKRNTDRHYQQYLRKHRTQKSEDTKIKFKPTSEFNIPKKRQTSEHKIIHSQYQIENRKQFPLYMESQQHQNNNWKINPVKKAEKQKQLPSQKNQNQKMSIKVQQQYQSPQKHILDSKIDESSVLNTVVKNSSIKKIVLNDQTYNIDLQKMKNRRLKTKQRFSKSILSNVRNGSFMLNGFSVKPSANMSSNLNGISSLQIQSHLNSQSHSNIDLNPNNSNSQNILKSLEHESKQPQKLASLQNSRNQLPKKIRQKSQKPELHNQYYENNQKHFQRSSKHLNNVKSSHHLIKVKRVVKTQKIVPVQDIQINDQYEIRNKFNNQKEAQNKDQQNVKKLNFPHKQTWNQDQKRKQTQQFLRQSYQENQHKKSKSTKDMSKNPMKFTKVTKKQNKKQLYF